MAESIAHKAERKAFEVAIDAALKHVDKDREKAMLQFIDLMEKILGDTWSPAAYEALRNVYKDPDSKWNKFTNDLFDSVDHKMLKMAALNLAYEAGFRGYKTTKENAKKYGCSGFFCLILRVHATCIAQAAGQQSTDIR